MNKSISLYIHIPFCHKKCNYCDFYSISEKFLDNNLIKKYTESIVNELQFYKPLLKNYSIESIYFGGGTPNCIDNNILYDFLYKFFIELNKINPGNPKEISEITMEMNPQFVTKAQINIIKDFPVNRISLGVQALDNKSLDFLGRNATLYETEKSIDMILSFFNNVSLDFIIGLPEQNIKKILNKIIKYSKAYNSLKHLSFYILNIAEGTLLYHNLYYNLYINKSQNKKKDIKKIKNLLDKIDKKSVIDYIKICKSLKKSGFDHYEISNFCKDFYYSKHNLRYWQLEPYIGLGTSAHSYIYDIRYNNTCLKEYLNIWGEEKILDYFDKNLEFLSSDNIYKENGWKEYLIKSMKRFSRNYEIIDKQKKINEYIMLSLRKSEGLDIKEFKKLFSIDFLKLKEDQINIFLKKKSISADENRIKINESSFIFYNEIVRNFLF